MLLKILGDKKWHEMDALISQVGKKLNVPPRKMPAMYGPTHQAKSRLKKRGLVKVEYRGGPVAITDLGVRHLSPNPPVAMPEAVWMATAILHRDHGADELFTAGQIADVVADKNLCAKPPSRAGLQAAITGTCVANTNAGSANHRLLYRAKPGKYRLYHKGDDYHKSRKGGMTHPGPKGLSPGHKDLVQWYKDIYNKRAIGDGQVVKRLASGPESPALAFRASLRYSKRTRSADSELEYAAARVIAGFLNSGDGDLLIGVGDQGQLLGLGDDFSTFSGGGRPSVDAFVQRLASVIDDHLGEGARANITINMVQVDGKDICHCSVAKSSSPAYLLYRKKGEPPQQQFIIRTADTTRHLIVEDAVEYILKHFHR